MQHYLIQFFKYDHLPLEISKQFCELAESICENLPTNQESAMALWKLLEAKDCAVRALLFQKTIP